MENMVNSKDFKSFYSEKKIFLTGHTGFKGSWMLCWLQMIGAEVKGYSLEAEEHGLYSEISGDSLCDSVIADIRDRERLKKEILDFQPDFIFHLAAQPLVRRSYSIPAETFEVNMMGTVYLLDAVRDLSKRCIVVVITTDKVYQNNEWHYPYRETDLLGGYDPYSASKATSELVVSSYRSSFFNHNQYENHGKSIATARAGNVIGGGDWATDRIIPDIVRSLQAKVPIPVRNPSSVRPWQHVLEPIGGYLCLGAKMTIDPEAYNEAWNFGPLAEDTLTVRELVEIAIQTWEGGSYELANESHQPHEAGLLKLDINKTINKLSWRPKLHSREAIGMTIDWYKYAQKERDGIYTFTKKQIQKYIQ